MKKQWLIIKICICSALLVPLLSGCWDAKELDSLSIVAGIGIDEAQEADEVCVTVQIGKSKAGQETKKDTGDGGGDPFILLEASEKSVLLALSRMRLKNSRILFLHHNQIIVIGSGQAKKGLEPVIDLFLRDNETRLDSWIIISEKKASDLLKVKLVQEPITAIGMSRILEQQKRVSPHMVANMLDLTTTLSDKGTSSVIPIMDTTEEAGKVKLAVTGLALFDDDKMVGRLGVEEALGFALTMGDMVRGSLNVTMEDGIAVMEISTLTTKATPNISGPVTIKLEVDAQLTVGELIGFKDVPMNDLFPRFEKAANETIKELIEKTFKKTQQFKTDIYGYGLSIYRKHPKEWKQALRDDWDDIYANMVLDVNVKSTVLNTGKIANSLTMMGDQ